MTAEIEKGFVHPTFILTTCQDDSNLSLHAIILLWVLDMKILTIGELKTHFSEVLEHVKQGESVVISYGRKKEKVAALIPYRQLEQAKPRSLGILEGRAQCHILDDFSMSDEELLES